VSRRSHNLYRIDSAVIWASLAALWITLASALFGVRGLSSDWRVRAVLAGSAALAGIFATSALLALLLHLRKDRRELYPEDASP
jgi:hypothetical protein